MGGAIRKSGPTIADIAQLAGVSSQTVSRVSTGADNVRPETRARVLEAMVKLGYSPNQAARSLRNGTFGSLGLIAHRYERTGEVQIASGVIRAAEERGYTVTLLSIEAPDDEHWQQAAHLISNQAIDALIIVRAEEASPSTLKLPARLPVAVSDSRLTGHYPSVIADQVQGSIDAITHLLDLGHRTVHHIAGPTGSVPAQIREAGWQRCLESAGIVAPPVLRGDWTPKSGYLLGQIISRDPELTAVYVANDEMAIGLIRALHESGRRVPEDISVVGFDGIAVGEFIHPPLTTVRQDFARIGSTLVDVVLSQLNEPDLPPSYRTVIPTELVIRNTTAPPRG